jgi:hypothetical protein
MHRRRAIQLSAFAIPSIASREVSIIEARSATHGNGGFCVQVDYEEVVLFRASSGKYVRAWTAENSASGIRFVYSVLAEGLVTPGLLLLLE